MMPLHPQPERLFAEDRKINLYYLHESFKYIASVMSNRMSDAHNTDIPISSGMWGGSYLIADEDGKAKTNVVRLYALVNLPQGTPLDRKENFEEFVKQYGQTAQSTLNGYGLQLEGTQWGEPIPFTNLIRPTTTLQMWDRSQRVKFFRAFFVWNQATWEDSIIYDAVRNVKQIKQLLNLNQRPPAKDSQEKKFLLQDVLIIYYTLKEALTTDFREHAEPVIKDLMNHFLAGLNDDDVIEEQYNNVYKNALVYGYEEALEGPYKKDHLDIHQIENWPVEKINWAPKELQNILGPYLKGRFDLYKANLEKKKRQADGLKKY